jgi:hypothetical protein
MKTFQLEATARIAWLSFGAKINLAADNWAWNSE